MDPLCSHVFSPASSLFNLFYCDKLAYEFTGILYCVASRHGGKLSFLQLSCFSTLRKIEKGVPSKKF